MASVAILGGGVAGLSAAHELRKRGFGVTVYEAGATVGGKARSLGVPGSGIAGRPDLPAEHGFRFFPGFYRHLPATMKEITVGAKNAFDHLRPADEILLARTGGKESILAPAKLLSLDDLAKAFESFTMFYCDLGVPKAEVMAFVRCLLKMLISCDQRRFNDYENQSWFQFIEAASKSAAYQRYLAKGLSRSLVALNAEQLSARTGGCILLQFLLDFSGLKPIDRVLDLPTNEAWLTPWREQLASRGVVFRLNSPVKSITCSGGRVTKVRVHIGGTPFDISADYYIAAVPVEKMKTLLNPQLLAAAPGLNSIHTLDTAWMTGIIFYLNKDVPICRGHVNFLDSNWALTSISQAQFWPDVDLSDYGDGSVRGVLSVIISNWGAPLFGAGEPARNCLPDEVIEAVWQQLKDHLNSTGTTVLDDSDRVTSFLAPCLEHNPTAAEGLQWSNHEPLFINTKGSWPKRPEAVTAIPNFFLASDYVQTFTDLACMEGANEAARRAVNGILQREGRGDLCEILPMQGSSFVEDLRLLDEFLFAIGQEPLVPPLPPLAWPCP